MEAERNINSAADEKLQKCDKIRESSIWADSHEEVNEFFGKIGVTECYAGFSVSVGKSRL